MTYEELKALNEAANCGLFANPHRKKKHIEDSLQIECVRWFTLQYPEYSALLHHSPNGGARSKVEGAIFKKMGVRPGFPDLFLYVPREYAPGKWYHGLAIEMKTEERGSRQSDVQKLWEKRLSGMGYVYCVARTVDNFISICEEYLGR